MTSIVPEKPHPGGAIKYVMLCYTAAMVTKKNDNNVFTND